MIKQIKQILDMKKPLLIFVPRIKELPAYEEYISSIFKASKIVSVYAGDKDRQAKVASFRKREIDILLTTTILERGVTFKHVQVIVIAADDPIYNTPSLVQIAGRVGRSADDRDGLVLFCYHKYTKSIREAMRQIRMMNR
ncbi:helicase C-terminal domain protein [Lactobacillus paragasseri JV-V03]|uniref:Helicase C-terminal domain protein n=1 Tax=Lactobacillus paragasseri JV-V03 TaxID=525326 RepID=A0AA87DDS2_9LACO|nr:helicase C-terminal domain protein [Lactobacillus paragasseri JV-V03]